MSTINFKGKSLIQNHHLTVKHHQLIPKKDKSLTKKVSLDDNLIIHGDNLKALKALLPTYTNKVKCIYIDPPYNTGNEKWVYNDNVSHPMFKDWLGKIVDNEDMTRHDKWLCMMTPRLKLLRELLRDDGVIFISIDDNEQHRLRQLMDEIFGQENFITNIIWQKKFSPQNDAKYFSDNHDFIIVYAKHKYQTGETTGWTRNLLPRTKNMEQRFKNPDNDPRGKWSSSDMTVKRVTPKDIYPIKSPSGKTFYPPKGRSWSISQKSFLKAVKENNVWFGTKGSNMPRYKRFRTNVQEGIVPVTVWLHNDVGHNQNAKQELKKIFPESETPFSTPKPTSLIKRVLELSTNKDDIVLDSFAGSGTTAHAVLQLNKEDGGNRKFILVEMEDYADEITAERVRRVIKKGLGGSFSYFELGDPIEMESILSGKNLPSFKELARYVFYTATGEEFDESKLDEKRQFIGESKTHEVFLFYKPDLEYLRNTALTLDRAKALGKLNGKRRLVFAPTKYLDQNYLDQYQIDFAQLPFEIYKMKG